MRGYASEGARLTAWSAGFQQAVPPASWRPSLCRLEAGGTAGRMPALRLDDHHEMPPVPVLERFPVVGGEREDLAEVRAGRLGGEVDAVRRRESEVGEAAGGAAEEHAALV